MASVEEAGTVTLGSPVEVIPEFSRFEHATVGAMYMLFAISGIVTNILLLVTFFKDKTLLRGSSLWFHVSLTIANIFVVAPAPFPASSSFSGRWLYGDKLCQAYSFEGMFVGIFAIGCIICLCLERYVVSSRAPGVQTTASSFYWLATGLNVANAFFWAVMPLLGWSRYAMDHTGAACAIDWHNADESYTSYMTMLCFFSFFLPITAALLALYKASPADVTSAASSASGQQTASSSGCQDAAASGLTESTLRGLSLTFLLLALAGWGPFAILCVWAMVGQPSTASMLAAALPPLACKMMTSSYPIAYNVACPRLRRVYLGLVGLDGDNTAAKTD